jgi:hypothetical protein
VRKEQIIKILKNPKSYIEYLTIKDTDYIKIVDYNKDIYYISYKEFQKVEKELKKCDELMLESLGFVRIVYKLKGENNESNKSRFRK